MGGAAGMKLLSRRGWTGSIGFAKGSDWLTGLNACSVGPGPGSGGESAGTVVMPWATWPTNQAGR
ncbi:hypothetical protein GCM10029992_22560 [Glycomyces albus]